MAEYIEREALRNEILRISIDTSNLYGCGVLEGLDRATKRLNAFPAADVAPVVHGRWKSRPMIVNTTRLEVWMCSVCGVEKTRTSIYCPNCGARMDGE